MGQNLYGAVCAEWNETVLTHLLRTAAYAQPVWEIRQETGRYLAPMWQESNFWQASLHCLPAASTKQICQLFGQFCRNIWCARSMDAHPSIIRAALLAKYSSECNSLPQAGRLGTAQGLKYVLRPCHGVAWRHSRPASRTPLDSPWLSLPPSLSSSLWSRPPQHPVPPFPIPIQLLADAKRYLQPPLQETWREQHRLCQGLVAGGLSGNQAGWGWGMVKVCPGRAGTARFYDIQVFPLPAFFLAVKTELDHKHLNLKQEKK